MPIYEYQCKACGHRLEVLQKMTEDALTDCPQCGQSTLTKLVSAAAFRLKGQGWYETDFKNSNQKGLASGHDSAEDKSSDANSSADTPVDKVSSENSTPVDSTTSKTVDKPAAKNTDKSTTSAPAAGTSSSSGASE
jgi:putative FmdB family regulatory protein